MIGADWVNVTARASSFGTPFYLLWPQPFERALAELNKNLGSAGLRAVRHWYSFKTLPVPRMVDFVRKLGFGLEIVSSYELLTALHLGFSPKHILVNGVAKHTWLTEAPPLINVIFDSLTEIERLAGFARDRRWVIGLRVAVSNQRDPDDPRFPAQFGFWKHDLEQAVSMLRAYELTVDILHFHLRTNVSSPKDYGDAISELAKTATQFNIIPRAIDVGGGLPDQTIGAEDAPTSIDLEGYASVLANSRSHFPQSQEIWLENGRHLLGPAAVLVVTVQDIKEIDGIRFLICDGGRTNHALESDWSHHDVIVLNSRKTRDDKKNTVICGPTCMAYDWFYRGFFPSDVKQGDRLLYLNAGAYHIPWETRFSHGLARVLWTDDGETFEEIRSAETFEQWLSRWNNL